MIVVAFLHNFAKGPQSDFVVVSAHVKELVLVASPIVFGHHGYFIQAANGFDAACQIRKRVRFSNESIRVSWSSRQMHDIRLDVLQVSSMVRCPASARSIKSSMEATTPKNVGFCRTPEELC